MRWLLAALMPMSAWAVAPVQQAGNLGLGIGSGTHVSGLSGKYHLTDGMAAQAMVGWWGLGRGDVEGISLSASYLIEPGVLARADGLTLEWNVGLGVNAVLADNTLGAGVHGVVGLELNLEIVPVDLVIEYRPGLRLLPATDPDFIGLGVHLRVYPFGPIEI